MKEKENRSYDDSSSIAEPVEVPFARLDAESLEGIIKDFILREGTDYGSTEFSLETKITQVKSILNSGKAKIYFDPESETCTILTPQQLAHRR